MCDEQHIHEWNSLIWQCENTKVNTSYKKTIQCFIGSYKQLSFRDSSYASAVINCLIWGQILHTQLRCNKSYPVEMEKGLALVPYLFYCARNWFEYIHIIMIDEFYIHSVTYDKPYQLPTTQEAIHNGAYQIMLPWEKWNVSLFIWQIDAAKSMAPWQWVRGGGHKCQFVVDRLSVMSSLNVTTALSL